MTAWQLWRSIISQLACLSPDSTGFFLENKTCGVWWTGYLDRLSVNRRAGNKGFRDGGKAKFAFSLFFFFFSILNGVTNENEIVI